MQPVQVQRALSGLGISNFSKLTSINVESWFISEPITVNTGISNQIISGLVVDFSQLVLFAVLSTRVMLFETNDSGAPADSFSTVADLPYVWLTGDYNACLITEDVTAGFVTNASGDPGTIQFVVGHGDATP